MPDFKIKYSEPNLCHYEYNLKKEWFVYFYITNLTTGQRKKCQFRHEINREKTKNERLVIAKAAIGFWKEQLAGGWHPWMEATREQKQIYPYTPFCEALDFALSKCNIALASKRAYKSTVKFCKEAAPKVYLSRKKIADIRKSDIMMLFEQIKKDRDWSNDSYNKHIGYLGSILGQLEQWEVITFNPAHGITPLPEVETEKYVPLTDAEKKIVRDYLSQHHYRFFVIVSVLYATGIRPKEILALKIKDVNLTKEEITILPDLEAENSKTKSIRKVPIDKHLLPLLQSLNLHDYPVNYYVFGSPFAPGRGNQGSSRQGRGAAHPDYFKPSATMVKRDTVTKFWNKVVIKKLGINKQLYALKHTGANDKIKAGVELDALRTMYGHSSKSMTTKYVTQIKEIHSKDIKDKSPGL